MNIHVLSANKKQLKERTLKTTIFRSCTARLCELPAPEHFMLKFAMPSLEKQAFFRYKAFYRQQPKMLEQARKLMDDPALSWRDVVGQFLHNICYGGQSRFAIMSVEEQQALVSAYDVPFQLDEEETQKAKTHEP